MGEVEYQIAKMDENGVPWDFPADLDTSGWPKKFPQLLPTHARSKGAMWKRGKNPVYQEYIRCLDELVRHVEPTVLPTMVTPLRRTYHRLFCMRYGYMFPPYKPEDKRAPGDASSKSGSGPPCPPEHLAALTRAGDKVKKQPDPRESAIWISEKVALVFGLGWDAVQPKDVIGLAAVGMLDEAVKDRKGFYEKNFLQYAVKPKEKVGRGFRDDGSEQLDYAAKLEKRYAGAG